MDFTVYISCDIPCGVSHVFFSSVTSDITHTGANDSNSSATMHSPKNNSIAVCICS